MKIETFVHDGLKADISVDAEGIFRAEYEGQDFRETTLQAVREKLKKVLKRAKSGVSIPVTVINRVPAGTSGRYYGKSDPFITGLGVVHAVLRAKHETRSCYLLTAEDGQKFEVGTYKSDVRDLCRRLTDEEEAEYLRLTAAAAAADAAVEAFSEKMRLDATEALKYPDWYANQTSDV